MMIGKFIPIKGDESLSYRKEFNVKTMKAHGDNGFAGLREDGEDYHVYTKYWKFEPAWNGEGSPPVGTECEALYGLVWHPCVVVAHYDGFVFAWNYDHRITFTFDDIAIAAGEHLRPARTEAERKRDLAVGAMERSWESVTGVPAYDFEKIYDDIAAGKIPGVRLSDD